MCSIPNSFAVREWAPNNSTQRAPSGLGPCLRSAAGAGRYVYKERTKGYGGIINNNALDLINIKFLRPPLIWSVICSLLKLRIDTMWFVQM